jgi:septal ring factor EnvC (AmiA/AmiB activator)
MLAMTISNSIWPDWLPTLLMVAGVLILGVLAGLMIRDRRDAQRANNACETQFDQNQFEESREILAGLASAVDSLDAALSQLRQQASQTQQRLDHLETRLRAIDQASRSNAHPTIPHPAAQVSEIKSQTSQTGVNQSDAAAFAQSVLALSDSGRTPIEIAHALHEHIGKVELVLALRKL